MTPGSTTVLLGSTVLLAACPLANPVALGADGGADIPDAADVAAAEQAVDVGPDASSEATCDPSRLILRQLVFYADRGPGNCADFGIAEVRLWLFQAGAVVTDRTLPCDVDTVDVGPVSPGDYDLAMVATSSHGTLYILGPDALAAMYPLYTAGRRCWGPPLPIVIASCGVTTVSTGLCCNEGDVEFCGP